MHNFLRRAGELFFSTLDKVEFSTPIPDKYKTAPVVEDELKVKHEFFREYWLCILGLFSGETELLQYVETLGTIKPPPNQDWMPIADDLEILDRYMITHKDYLHEICKASIDMCNIIIVHLSNDKIKMDPKRKIILYKKLPLCFGGEKNWKLFNMLYYAGGKTVTDKEIEDEFSRSPTGMMSELKRFLSDNNAKVISKAIIRKRDVGYRLDSSLL